MSALTRAVSEAGDSVRLISSSLTAEYRKTPANLKVLDCFCVYAVATAAVQVLYMLAVGSFPFNSFLSGLFCSVGFFVLTAALRMQLTPANKGEFPGLTLERAVADYVVAAMLLFFVTWNFMG